MGIIIGMTSLTIGSAIAQIILTSMGKVKESQMAEVTTTCLLIGTMTASIVKAIKAISSLG